MPAIQEFKRFKEDGKKANNGNGKYHIAKGEAELVQRLHDGWNLVQSLNGDKYLLQKT